MRPNIYKILDRCIEEGAAAGMRRAFKHTDTPSRDEIENQVCQHIMNEICEYFEFQPYDDPNQG